MDILPERFRVEDNAKCVVCGRENNTGLQILFLTESSGKVAARWQTSMRYEGFKGLVHGGILATVLDEAMSKAVYSLGVEALTGDLRVRYHKRIEPGETVYLNGWVVKKRGRLIKVEAALCSLDGSEYCHSWATFAIVPGAPIKAELDSLI